MERQISLSVFLAQTATEPKLQKRIINTLNRSRKLWGDITLKTVTSAVAFHEQLLAYIDNEMPEIVLVRIHKNNKQSFFKQLRLMYDTRKRNPSIQVVAIIDTSLIPKDIFLLFCFGAIGYVRVDQLGKVLVPTIIYAFNLEGVIDHSVASCIVQRIRGEQLNSLGFTRYEIRILEALARTRKYNDVSKQPWLQSQLIRRHIGNVLLKIARTFDHFVDFENDNKPRTLTNSDQVDPVEERFLLALADPYSLTQLFDRRQDSSSKPVRR